MENSFLIKMPILPSAVLSARPIGPAPTAPPMPFAVSALPTPAVRPVAMSRPAVESAPRNTVTFAPTVGKPMGGGEPKAKASGRSTKEERKKEARMAVNAEIRALIDAKPTKREVRNFLHRRMTLLNDG